VVNDNDQDTAAEKEKIRALVDTWMRASIAGDISQILPLMAEDVVFLVCGHPPMRGRDTVAAGFGAVKDFRMEGQSEIQEIEVSGNLAYCWNHISVTITPKSGGQPMRRSGYALSVLRKQPDGSWVITRDANLLAPKP
jgi:uncharacterized protein (TIGR02246 family)